MVTFRLSLEEAPSTPDGRAGKMRRGVSWGALPGKGGWNRTCVGAFVIVALVDAQASIF